MPTTLIQPKRFLRGASTEKLRPAERVFVQELLADDLWRPKQAAIKAGYKSPTSAASKLLNRADIQALLGFEQRRRLERIGLKADEVLNMLAQALFFNPLSLFKPTANGSWAVTDLDSIPPEIGRCITKIKSKTTEQMDDEGNVTSVTYFEMEFLDKTRLLELAMKHCGVQGSDKVQVQNNLNIGVDQSLAQLLQNLEAQRNANVIDARVIDAKVQEPNEQAKPSSSS